MTPIEVSDQGIRMDMFNNDPDARMLTTHAQVLPPSFFYLAIYDQPAERGLKIEDGSVWQLQPQAPPRKGQSVTPKPARLLPTPETLAVYPDYDGWEMMVYPAGYLSAQQLPALEQPAAEQLPVKEG